MVVDAGNGVFLKYLLDTYKPANVIVAVSRWEDFVSSFEVVDWQQLFSEYSKSVELHPNRIGIHLSRIDHSNEILNKISTMDISSLVHAFLCFCSDSSDQQWSL